MEFWGILCPCPLCVLVKHNINFTRRRHFASQQQELLLLLLSPSVSVHLSLSSALYLHLHPHTLFTVQPLSLPLSPSHFSHVPPPPPPSLRIISRHSPFCAGFSSCFRKLSSSSLPLCRSLPASLSRHPGIYGGKRSAGVGHEAGERGRRRRRRRWHCGRWRRCRSGRRR